jgi:hypothetical protein
MIINTHPYNRQAMFSTPASYDANFPDTLTSKRSGSESNSSDAEYKTVDKPKVPIVSVYKGTDELKAKSLCSKDSQGYPFLFYKSEMNKTKTLKTTIL